ncbi:SNF2-related protein [Propionivibrio sp.]|uniref:SNF2-related protein n=1 Tax=Propionivibrio sp. TaxID=2212460 RepID=UPI003BEFC1FE
MFLRCARRAAVVKQSFLGSKVLLTATPLQNSLLELYGLVSMIDDRVFGDLDSFRAQFTQPNREQPFAALRSRIAPICKRTLRRQVHQYVPYTARRAIVEEFTPSTEERELSALVADYLRRPNLKALPDGQRQLISLVLWKLRQWSRPASFCWKISTKKCRTNFGFVPTTVAKPVTDTSEC